MKYIDADKLTKFEETLADIIVSSQGLCTYEACKDMAKREAPFLIASLQQEQLVNKDLGTLITCDIIEMTVKKAIDNPQDKEKEEELMTRKINYLRSLEENYVQQEQPEVDNQ